MSNDTIRLRRVSELLRREISAILTRDTHNTNLSSVYITHVKVAGDLSHARVYYGALLKDDMERISKELPAQTGFVRKKLMERIRIKRLPSITFERDVSAEYAEKIDAMLADLK